MITMVLKILKVGYISGYATHCLDKDDDNDNSQDTEVIYTSDVRSLRL